MGLVKCFVGAVVSSVILLTATVDAVEYPKATVEGYSHPEIIKAEKLGGLGEIDSRSRQLPGYYQNVAVNLPDGYKEPEPPVFSDSPEVQAALGIQSAPTNVPVYVDSIGPNDYDPPNPICAGGTNHVIVATNDNFAIYDRFGVQIEQHDINTFLDDDSPIFFPRVIWDKNSDRFFMSWLRVSNSGPYSEAYECELILMVSRSSDPIDGWIVYRLDVEDDPNGNGGNKHTMDFPHIGVQRDAVTISGRYFPWPGGGGTGTYDRFFILNKNAVISALPAQTYSFTDVFTDGTSTVNAVALVHFTQRFSTVDPTQSMAYFMAAKDFSTNNLWLLRMRIDPTDSFPTIESYDPINVGTYAAGPGLTQNGAADLKSLSPRLMNGVYYQSHFYTTHAVAAGANSGHRTYKIGNSAGYPVVWNSVWSHSNFDYGQPAVAVDNQARAIVAYTYAGSSISASAAYGGRESGDADWSGSYYNRQGAGVYELITGVQSNWGQHSGASVDAWDENSFWIFGQAVSGNDNWDTGLSRVSYKPFYSIVASDETVETTDTVALTATVTLSGSPVSGKLVSFFVLNQLVGSATTNGAGVAEFNYTSPLGTPSVSLYTAKVAEDTDALADTDTGLLSVVKHTPQIIIFTRSGQYGSVINYRILLRRASDLFAIPGRIVKFKIAGVMIGEQITDANGEAFLDHVYLAAPGAYTQTGDFGGDGFFNSDTDTAVLTLNQASTNISIDNVVGVVGQNASLVATLRRTHDSSPLDNRIINFTVGGVAVGSAQTNAAGIATLTSVVPAGVFGDSALVAAFSGTVEYVTSTGTAVFRRTANSILAVDNKAGERGQTVALTATLTRAHDGLLLANRTVNFTVDGSPVGSALTDASGVASTNFTIPPGFAIGDYPIGATFSTVGFLNGSIGSATLAVGRSATTLSLTDASGTAGQTVNLLSQLIRTGDSAPISGATINYSIAGLSVGSATTNASGVASRSVTIPVATLGAKVLAVQFTGNSDYLPSSSNGVFTLVGKTIGGTVLLQDWTGPIAGRQIAVQVFTSAGTLIEQFMTTLDAGGSWQRTNSVVSTGAHIVKVKASHWLARDRTVSINNAGNNSINHSLFNGDCDGDNEVGGGDLSLLSAAFLTAQGDPGFDADADLDGDGEVGSSDLSILSTNFLLSGD